MHIWRLAVRYVRLVDIRRLKVKYVLLLLRRFCLCLYEVYSGYV